MKNKVLAEARNASGLTQGDMAKALGVSLVTISKWENGHVALKLGMLQDYYRICNEQGKEIIRSLDVLEGVA